MPLEEATRAHKFYLAISNKLFVSLGSDLICYVAL